MPSILFNIEEEDYSDFEVAFLKENPIPADSVFTLSEWIKEWGRLQYLRAVERGRLKLAQENVVVNSGIITCSPIK